MATPEERAEALIDALVADRGYGRFTAGVPCGDLWDDPRTLLIIAAAIREAAAAERERCAAVCDRTADSERSLGDEGFPEPYELMAARIREGGAA